MKKLLISSAFFLCITALAQESLYHVKLIRAAPGELLNVIDLIKADMGKYEDFGIQRPYLMRHSQGAQWDLMYMQPVEDLSSHFAEESRAATGNSNTLGKTYGDPIYNKISWEETAIMSGPPHDQFHDWMGRYDYYHIEIFIALAGKQSELLKERQMENVYLEKLERRPNFIFTRVMGPSWDIFTLGCYEDIKDYTSSADIPIEQEEAAAIAAGFQGVAYIGSYLRELILEHHDTLAGAVR